jgi:hypothetical protein
MTIGTLVTSSIILLVTAITGLSEAVPEQPKDAFPKWAFCVAYQVQDPGERDALPVDPNAEKDPFSNGETFSDAYTRMPHNLINDRNVVNVAALTMRLVKSAVLKHQAAEGVLRGATAGTRRHPLMECYNPHHLFVFYGDEGHPVAAIEVCFSCNRVKMTPEIRAAGPYGGGTFGTFETADLAGLAKIASEAGLDLKPFASLDAYVQSLDQPTKRIEEVNQAGTEQHVTGPESKSEGSDKPQPEAEGRSR